MYPIDVPNATLNQAEWPFVGSPEHDDGIARHLSVQPSSSVEDPNYIQTTRPILEQRSSSFSYRSNRIASSFRHPTPTGQSEQQWTLFRELMDAELRDTESRRKRASYNHSSTGLPPSLNSADPVSRVQSPVEDLPDPPTRGGMTAHASTDYNSDTSATSSSSQHSPEVKSTPCWYSTQRLPTLSTLHRNIIKCVIAYFIASLFTFSPYLSSFISDITSDNEPGQNPPSPAGHMVATIAVYFNPAKTIGGMMEADLYCFLGLAYATFISLSSMAMFWWIDLKPGLAWLADVLAILWIGVGIAGVTWTKAWMNSPSFGTACSMTVIVLFVVVANEGGLDTLLSVSFIVFVGVIVSNLICYCLWPQSATVNLQDNMIKTLDSFSTLLRMLTNTFLLEEPLHPPSHDKLQKAVESHQSSFTSLKKNLAEAHSEWFYGGPSGSSRSSSGAAYEDAVDSLNRLAQHLNGLRSGTRLQYDLTKAHAKGKVILKNRPMRSKQAAACVITDDPLSGGTNGKGKGREEDDSMPGEETALLQVAAAAFADIVDDLGPPMKALSTACTSSLKRLREAFVNRQSTRQKDVIKPQEFLALVNGIERALFSFDSTSNHALLRLYRRNEHSAAPSRNSMKSFVEDHGILSSGDNETVFLIYFFIFTLQEFAQELVSLIDAMGRIYTIEQQKATRHVWGRRAFVEGYGSVLSFLRRSWTAAKPGKPERRGLQRRISTIIIPRDRRKKPMFPKVTPHAPNTMQTPSRDLSIVGRANRILWIVGARLRKRDIKYAFKAGMGTAALAAPAFFDSTRPVFMAYRGEWALISFFLVISPTIGATNFLSIHRVLGTFIGATVAVALFELFSGNAVALSILGALYSIPCFYYIVAVPKLASPARFNLLTYNLICLYCYNLRQNDLSVLRIAWHRSIAVTIGVIWAAVLSRFLWPAEARKELAKGLGEFCLNIGWLYTRLVASYSFAPEIVNPVDDDDDTEGTPLLSRAATTKLNNSIQEFMAMELHLQIKLIELQSLLAQAQHEPRLKGPFPVPLYRSILTSLQTILDKLHSMRCVTTREEWYTSVRQDFIIPVNRERHEMVGNIILYFSTLASAFRVKAPLPPYLPPAENSRQRLVDAIRRLDVVKNREAKGSRQLLYFAYALMMQGVIRELDYLGHTLQAAFGVIGDSPEEFDALFRDEYTTADQAV